MYQSTQPRGGLSSTARWTKCPLCVRSKYSKLPSACPTKRSKSPSPSQSDMKGLIVQSVALVLVEQAPFTQHFQRDVSWFFHGHLLHPCGELYRPSQPRWLSTYFVTTKRNGFASPLLCPPPGWNVSRIGNIWKYSYRISTQFFDLFACPRYEHALHILKKNKAWWTQKKKTLLERFCFTLVQGASML